MRFERLRCTSPSGSSANNTASASVSSIGRPKNNAMTVATPGSASVYVRNRATDQSRPDCISNRSNEWMRGIFSSHCVSDGESLSILAFRIDIGPVPIWPPADIARIR